MAARLDDEDVVYELQRCLASESNTEECRELDESGRRRPWRRKKKKEGKTARLGFAGLGDL
jgi:hypothetical protein